MNVAQTKWSISMACAGIRKHLNLFILMGTTEATFCFMEDDMSTLLLQKNNFLEHNIPHDWRKHTQVHAQVPAAHAETTASSLT